MSEAAKRNLHGKELKAKAGLETLRSPHGDSAPTCPIATAPAHRAVAGQATATPDQTKNTWQRRPAAGEAGASLKPRLKLVLTAGATLGLCLQFCTGLTFVPGATLGASME